MQAIMGDTIPHPETLIFAGRTGRRLADSSLLKLARRIEPGITVHGFRSCFRDWVGDETEHRREIAEFALAHKVVGVEGNYRRGKALKKRRRLMEDWAQYCATIPAESAAADQVA